MIFQGGAVPMSAVELVTSSTLETKIVLVICLIFSLASWFVIPTAQPPGRTVLQRDGDEHSAARRLPVRDEAAAVTLSATLPRGRAFL